MTEVRLRHMTREEFDAYFAGAVDSYAEELCKSGRYPDAGQARAFALWEYKDIFSQGYRTPGTEVYHIFDGAKKIGFIWMLREEDSGFIGDFLIDSACRHQGYGTKAMRCLERRAAEAGIKTMRLGVFKNNTAARRLYEKQGYTVVRDREVDLMMEKKLAVCGDFC